MRLVVAVCLLLVVSLSSCASAHQGPPLGPDPGAGRPAEAGRPPAGMRWQGLRDVVVAVPKGWRTQTDPCPRGSTPAVRFVLPHAPVYNCPLLGPGDAPSSLLLIGRTGAAGLPRVHELGHRTRVHGLVVRYGDLRCSADHTCTLAFAVPGAGVEMEVSERGRHARRFVEDLRDSVVRVRAGRTTVPPLLYGAPVAQARRVLRSAGLVPRLPGGARGQLYVTGSRPAPGSVVRTGATVTLTVGDG